jgi:hypothetical protein
MRGLPCGIDMVRMFHVNRLYSWPHSTVLWLYRACQPWRKNRYRQRMSGSHAATQTKLHDSRRLQGFAHGWGTHSTLAALCPY